jgi:transcriptional regulator with XRE-family HTH domain
MSQKVPGNLLRAARELLGWSQRELAERADCGLVTVQRIEKGGTFHVEGTREKIVEVIQNAGVRFLPQTTTEGAGIRWATPDDQPSETPAKRRVDKSTKIGGQ